MSKEREGEEKEKENKGQLFHRIVPQKYAHHNPWNL